MTDTMVRYQEFRLPDVGEGLQDAEIARWHVGVGDTVTDGQVVCEIETAKAMVELPVPFAGVVRELRFPEGTTVDVGEVIITVAPPGADLAPAAVAAPAQAPAPAAAVTQAPAEPARQPVLVGYGAAAAPTSRRPRRQAPAPSAAPAAHAVPAVPVRGAERAMAKPPVRKLARDLGVDLGRVRPSGRHGDITREDVRTAAAEAVQVPVPVPAQAQAHETRIPASAVRKATARAMTESAFGAPHVTEFVTVDVTRTMKLVERLRKDPEFAGVRVSPLLLAVRALLFAVRRHPEINASWDEERQEIVLKHRVNLGIAAATPRGLLVPNIKDAQSLSLPRLAAALDGLVTTAREGRTTPADLGGGTLTVTNIGVFGIDTGTPILNPGEAAILALGAIGPRPWVHRGEVVPRQVTTLALSFDHRLVDGELGSRVLADVAAVLHDPRRLATHG
ncbi:dihydrolipoamide acetyltransferase family protein [Streptomyces sp. NBC_00347]|uniref:dihydrolipoamide acetyltransferase family protein n=1 Tax=Streptomyces sp. NBC_00347 TaxID=2975721 RepID=UPI00225C3B6C|nr:dihydrolipoamide acetyltransferase family protein [Streptomyces sp. NBC_00347]MCX5124681.1 2-oxo acid dehydrogenase subunit E2 [Streptomyces sp. NBC_00347]